MLWVAYVLLIVSGLFLKNSKTYDALVILFMGFVAWANTDSADYSQVYVPAYINPSAASGMDPGWLVLCEVGNAVGLSYNGFACLITIISLVALRWFGKRAGTNTSLMLSLFLVYPGLMSIVQFRQFVASAVGAIAIIIFLSHLKYKNLWFVLVAAIAFLIHGSAAILMLLLLWPILIASGRKGRVITAMAMICLCIGVVANANAVGSALFGESRTTIYLGASGGLSANDFMGGAKNAILVVMVAIITYICCRQMARDGDKAISDSVFSLKKPDAPKIIMFFNVISTILVPLVFITNDFMRFERYAFTYALALFAMMPAIKQRHPVFSCKALYLVICAVFAYFYVANTFDSIYGALLSFETLPPFFS